MEGKNFANKLKAFRKRAGLTQQELANMVNVSLKTVQRWEHEERQPRVEELKKLTEALHISETDLLSETPDRKVQITISWNWEEMKKGVIDMDKDKFKLILGEDGAIGLQGAGKFTNREAINDFIAEVRNQLEIAFDAQVRRGAIQEA